MTRADLEAAIWAAMDTHRIQGPRRAQFVTEVMHAAGKYAAFRNNSRHTWPERQRHPWALTEKAEGVLAKWDAWEAQMTGTLPRPRRVTMRDDSLPHQIVIFALSSSSKIAVSCNCLRGIDGTRAHYSPLEVRYRWEPGEPMAIWRAHVAALEEAL